MQKRAANIARHCQQFVSLGLEKATEMVVMVEDDEASETELSEAKQVVEVLSMRAGLGGRIHLTVHCTVFIPHGMTKV